MDGRRGGGGGGGGGRGRGRGRGRSRGGGRWSPRRPFNHPQPQPPPPPPVAGDGDGDDVCGSGSRSGSNKEGRITCSEDDKSVGSACSNNHHAINMNMMPHSHSHSHSHSESESQCECEVSNSNSNSNTHHQTHHVHVHLPLPEVSNSNSNTHHQTHHVSVPVPDPVPEPFDICPVPTEQSPTVVLKPPLLVTNRERRNQIKRQTHSQRLVLRPGMVLLKSHISLSDQVKIVKRCRELGVGSGGFYQPGYGYGYGEEGTKLHLKMMCLGKHWDPLSSHYGDHRPCDGAKPPNIPPEFHQLVHTAIAHSHALIHHEFQTPDPRKILPPMTPDICVVNFYSQNGRLGLHQDKDESQQSLGQGLPVVSFSIGDSADFLYGDERDVDKAQKLVLESGDVLIFGGKSRNVFHGVTAIHPMTAPSVLLHQTNLRPGRLNLTFRQY